MTVVPIASEHLLAILGDVLVICSCYQFALAFRALNSKELPLEMSVPGALYRDFQKSHSNSDDIPWEDPQKFTNHNSHK